MASVTVAHWQSAWWPRCPTRTSRQNIISDIRVTVLPRPRRSLAVPAWQCHGDSDGVTCKTPSRCPCGTPGRRRRNRSLASAVYAATGVLRAVPVRLEVGVTVTVTGSRRYDSAAESYFYWPPGRRGRGSVVLTRSTPRRAAGPGPGRRGRQDSDSGMPVPCLCSLAARLRRAAGGRLSLTEVVGAGGANDYFCRRPGGQGIQF